MFVYPVSTTGIKSREIMKSIKVGLLGIGTVGAGTFAVLKRNQEEIARRAVT